MDVQKTVSLSFGEVPFTLRHNARRKRVSIVVTAEGRLEVRAPPGYDLASARTFLRSEEAWIGRRFGRSLLMTPEVPVPEDGAALPVGSEEITLRFHPSRRGRVRRVGQELWVPESARETSEQLLSSLERWYRKQAALLLKKRLDHWADRMQLSFGRLAIRSQKTRWGSCSAKGNINLNWRLLLMPEPVQDYVVVHELAHRVHMDHSPRFWALVARYLPDYAERKAVLKTFQPPL
ncbi:MAG: M48 family metallopeptidase [Magnetococcales bacterium]|nr:M48 family metallopeptidase [Magnetococcales bacterium]